jgi:hypothetical protein
LNQIRFSMKNLHKLLLLIIFCSALTANAQVSATFSRYVTNGNDDAEQRISTGAMDLTSSDLEITTDGSNNQLIGIRFNGIGIPKGATIDSAFIQFATKGDKAPVSGAVTIRSEMAANSATFTTTTNNISTRLTSSASVTWAGSTDASWGTCCANNRGAAQRTPNIGALVQAVMNQSAWNTGNPVTIIMNGSGVRNAQSFNGSATFAPELIVYYTQNSFSPLSFPLSAGSVWKYRDNGINPGANWASTSFNDSTWAFKPGKFGYGDSCQTLVSFGNDSNNKHVTTWFRTQFNMSNTAGFDTLIFKLLVDDGAVVYLNGMEVFRKNLPTGIITDSTLALTDVSGVAEQSYEEFRILNSLVNGLNILAVEVHQFSKQSNDLGFDLQLSAKRVPMTIVNFPVSKNSEWYYLDNGSDQGTAWRAPNFYDGNWNYGNGILGYGDASATTLGFGPNSSNKYITYYFRKQFNVSNVTALADSLQFNIMRDDGAVVYLNGVEVFKTNMPDTGVINYLTWAASVVDGANERTYYTYYVPKSLLVNGINNLAVQVHQRDGTSSDLSFDMEVKEDPRTLNLLNPTASQSVAAGQNLSINWYHIPSINRVNIELSTDNRITWTSISSNRLASDKPFVFGLPNINSSVSWIRISDSTNTYRDSVNFWIYPVPTPFNPCVDSLHIGCFASVPMARNQNLKQPSNHTFQQIARQGQTHNLGGTVGTNLDFTGFVSVGGSSKKGMLGVNEETTPGGVSVFYLTYNDTTGTWLRDSSGKVVTSDPGVVQFTRNCSGGITPWGTIITAEETYNTGDVNADGYQDVGWLVEYHPATRRVMDYNSDGVKDKLWAMGRMNHENVVIKNDSLTAYYGEDGGTSCVYKFVAFQKTRMDSGTLYVLQRNGSIGNWVLVPNQTQTQRNTIPSIASGLGGTNFNGVEDVEISPINGMVYFTSKNNARIYRFTDNGLTVSNFEEYVGNAAANYTMNVEGGGTQSANWGSGIDNLSFDNMGNLWAQQDGGNGHIWVIRPDHTPFAPKVDIYATTPSGSETSGLTFTPDFRYGFLSIMGASSANATSLTDAAGTAVVFNTSNTVVIANRKFLGALAAVPVEFYYFTVKAKGQNAADLQWSTASEVNNKHFLVERSIDGIHYQTISTIAGAGNSIQISSYNYIDAGLSEGLYYYRLKQVDFDGKYSYSSVRTIRIGLNQELALKVFPVPFKEVLSIGLTQAASSEISVRILDMNGKVWLNQNFEGIEGENELKLNVAHLAAGSYVLEVVAGEDKLSEIIVK